jgi:hypothetical protein
MQIVKASFMVSSMVAIMALAACGGGGGSSPAPVPPPPTGGTTPSPAPAPTPSATQPPAGPPVAITGTASFDSVPLVTSGASGSLLNYAGTVQKPVRGAIVEVVDNASQAVLASGVTTDTGTYSLNVPSNLTVYVRVRAQMQKSGAAPTWDFAVRDNTQGNALYSMVSPAFTAASGVVQNLNAPSGWSGSNTTGSYASTRVAGPFAILDTVYSAYNKILTAKADAAFPMLNVYWSPNNIPASGNRALGEIGTSFFLSDSQGNRSIYLLGAADDDTDEYDSPVVAHEWGHYFQDAFSRDDSIGGPHNGTDFLDIRVAFSEGWGNAWSGMVLNQDYYADSSNAGQQNGFRVDLSQPVASGDSPGWYKENSVQYILYSLHQNSSIGFTPIFDAMTGALRTGTAVTTIHSFAASVTDATAKSALNNLLAAQSIGQNLDQYGTSEPNNGGNTANLPLYKPLTVGQTLTNQCLNIDRGTPNKLGNALFYRFSVPAARAYTISLTGGTDPDFALYQNGSLGGGFSEAAGSEAASGDIQAGEAVLVINDAQLNANTCYSLSIQ